MSVMLAVLSALVSTSAVAHGTTLEHRGAAYQVDYRPHIAMESRTIGHSVGTRMSTERCLWTATVRVERQIRRAGEAASLDTVLPAARIIKGQQPGSCRQAGDRPAQLVVAQDDKLRAHVVSVAEQDRAAVISDIDAAHVLTSDRIAAGAD